MYGISNMEYLPETARKWAIATHLKELREGIRGWEEVECKPLQAFLDRGVAERRAGGDRRFKRLSRGLAGVPK